MNQADGSSVVTDAEVVTEQDEQPQELSQQEKDEQSGKADQMISAVHEAKRRVNAGAARSIEDALNDIADEREQDSSDDEDSDDTEGTE